MIQSFQLILYTSTIVLILANSRGVNARRCGLGCHQTSFILPSHTHHAKGNPQRLQHTNTIRALVAPSSTFASQKVSHHPAIVNDPLPTKMNRNSLALRGGASVLGSAGAGGMMVGPLSNFFKSYPYVVAFTICATKASAADWISQFAEAKKGNNGNSGNNKSTTSKRKSGLSLRRNLAFLCYGGVYQGIGQNYIYNNLFSALFGKSTSMATVFTKVLVDMLVVIPTICLPVAYLIKAAIFKYSPAEAARRYIVDIKENGLLVISWIVWAPAQALSFAFIPEHYRIPFMACVSFFWLIMVSSISGRVGKE
mmetsp:Transcript_18223/g.27667  ORF Transcript_18223/g.27667 Transcript_18223/m.27667 type:complete len:310 (+) Transcript_18223:244-1173(+)